MRYVFFIILLFSHLLHATILITDDTDKVQNFRMPYIHDVNASLDFDTLKTREFSDKVDNQFTFGYIPGKLWFKLEIENRSQKEKFVLNFTETFYENFILYSNEDGIWRSEDAGIATPIEQRSIYNSSPTFRLHIKPDTTKTYYLETYSRFAQVGEVKIHTYESFFTQTNPLIIGLYMFYFGALLTIIILNVFLSIRLQESIYAYYACYVSSFSLFILVFSGLDFYIGLGELHYLLHFAPSAVMLFLTLFSLKFLSAKKYAPVLYRILLLLSLAFAVLIILIAIDVSPWYMVMNNLSSITFALLIATALYIAKQDNPYAKYYLIIMIPTVFSLAFLSLMFTGDIANTDFYRYSFLVASLLEIGLFALILANRFFQMRELANRDALTKLYNRHYFNEISSGYFENSIRQGHNLSVLMIDIDDFKQLNDTYGHAFGDKVLIKTSEHLKNFSRKGDFIVRYGGEEFLFLIYDTPIESSLAMAKRICQYIQMSKLHTPKGEDIFITISAGLSQLDVNYDKSVEDIIRRADDALYRSKKEGKNRVSVG